MLQHPERYFKEEDEERLIKNKMRRHYMYRYNEYLYNNESNKIIDDWMNPHKFDYKIYRGKYSHDFELFIKDNRLGKEIDEGILVNREIALIYMSALAENIAKRQGYELSTDINDYKKFSHLLGSLWDKNNNIEWYKASEIVIDQVIPRDIREISVKQIIELRNSNGYNELMKSYNKTLKSFINDLNDLSEFQAKEYIRSIEGMNMELIGKVTSFLGTTIPVALTLVGNKIDPNIKNNLDYLVAGMGVAGSVINFIPNTNQYSFKDKKQSNKFISKLGRRL